MISLILSICLSVYLSIFYLFIYQFYLDLSVSVVYSVNGDTSPIELRYEHFCRQLSSLVSLPFFNSRSLFLFPPDFLFFAIPFSFLFHFFLFLPTYLFIFYVKTVTLFKTKEMVFLL